MNAPSLATPAPYLAICLPICLASSPAQDSKPAAERIVLEKHELSLVPPAGWKTEVGSDDQVSDRRAPLVSCLSDGLGGRPLRLSIFEDDPVVVLNARTLAESFAKSRKPQRRVVEAKDLRVGGSSAGLMILELVTEANGEKVPEWMLDCLVQGPAKTLVLHASGSPDDVQRHRPAIEQCLASVRLGKWAIPGTRFQHKKHPLSLVPPDGWREVPDASLDAWSFALASDEKQRPALLVKAELTAKEIVPTTYRSAVVALQRRTWKDFQCVDLRDATFGGKKFTALRCKLTQEGTPMLQLHHLLAGERPYVFVWTFREADLAAVQPGIEACLASVDTGKDAAAKQGKK